MSNEEALRAVLAQGAPVFREFLSAMVLHGQAAADAIGIGASDLYALNLLAALGPMTAGRLAERTGLTTGATTRLIDRLERSGYARRTASPSDRRSVLITAVDERLDQIADVFQPAQQRLGEVFLSYDPDQLEVLFDYFARATPALREAAQALRDQRHRTDPG